MSGLSKLILQLQDERSTQTSLSSSYDNLGDQGVGTLVEMLLNDTKIDRIALGCNNIGDTGAKHLATLLQTNSTIRSLDLDSNQIGPEGTKYLAQALKTNSTLEDLSLHSNKLQNVAARYLAEMLAQNSRLRTITLDRNSIGDEGARILADSIKNNNTLKELRLFSNKIGPQGAKYLLQNLAIGRFLIRKNPIGDEGVKYYIEALERENSDKKVTKVDLSSISCGHEAGRLLGSFLERDSTIIELDLGINRIGDDGVKYLTQGLENNSTLKSINLAENRIGNRGAQCLLGLLEMNPTLEVNVNGNPCIESELSSQLQQKINIGKLIRTIRAKADQTRLDLYRSNIEDGEAKYLADEVEKSTTINDLRIASNRIGPKGARSLAQALEINSSVEMIDLDRNRLGIEGVRYFANMLELNSKLKKIILSSNNIEDEGMRYLAEGLRNNRTLEHINVSSNKIGTKGAKYFAEILEQTSSIDDFMFYENNICSEGLQYIVDALKKNKTVKKIAIGSLNIREEDIKTIASLLETNTTIAHVWAMNCNIEDNEVKYIADALEKNTTLKCLQLPHNFIKDQGAAHILKMLDKNVTLEEIDLSSNGVVKEMMDLIKAKLAENKNKMAHSSNKKFNDTSSTVHQKKIAFDPNNFLLKKIAQLERDTKEIEYLLSTLDSRNPVVAKLILRFREFTEPQMPLIYSIKQDLNDHSNNNKDKIFYNRRMEIDDFREKIWDFEKEVKQTITTKEYARGQIIKEFRVLQERDPELYAYSTTFYWTALNLFGAYKYISPNDVAHHHIKEGMAMVGSSKAVDYGTDIVQATQLSGHAILALDKTIERIYARLVHDKNRINALSQIINHKIQVEDDKIKFEEDISSDVAKIALSVTEVKAGAIMDPQAKEPNDPLDKKVNRIKDEVLAALESANRNSPAAILALEDVILLVVYLCIKSTTILEGEGKLNVQGAEIFRDGKLDELRANYRKAKAEGCQLF